VGSGHRPIRPIWHSLIIDLALLLGEQRIPTGKSTRRVSLIALMSHPVFGVLNGRPLVGTTPEVTASAL